MLNKKQNKLTGRIIDSRSLEKQIQLFDKVISKMDQENSIKKYSKISPALKYFFLECLYFKNLTIKEAASRFKLNYSTAKVIIRDLSHKERTFVKRLLRRKEKYEKKYRVTNQKVCAYKVLETIEHEGKSHNDSEHTNTHSLACSVEVIARINYDFFSQEARQETQ